MFKNEEVRPYKWLKTERCNLDIEIRVSSSSGFERDLGNSRVRC